MARLSESQWAELRAEWEASPKQGLSWLIKAEGGRWEITEEAVRRRRLKDEWQKRGTLASVAEKAQLAADQNTAKSISRTPIPDVGQNDVPEVGAKPPARANEVGSKVAPPTSKVGREEEEKAEARSAITEQAAVNLRASLLERHRNEWNMARKVAYEAVSSRDFDKAKLAKITTETLRNIQDGERKAWGLDAPAEAPPGQTNNTVVVIERSAAPVANVIEHQP